MKTARRLVSGLLAGSFALSLCACTDQQIPAGTELSEQTQLDQHGQYRQLELTENSALARPSSSRTYVDPNLSLSDDEQRSATRFAADFVLRHGIDSPLVFDDSPQTQEAWLDSAEIYYSPETFAIVERELDEAEFVGVDNLAYWETAADTDDQLVEQREQLGTADYSLETPRFDIDSFEIIQVAPGPAASQTTVVQIDATWTHAAVLAGADDAAETMQARFTLFLAKGGSLGWQIHDYATDFGEPVITAEET